MSDESDAIVEHYEGEIREEDRITSGIGQLELVRTQEILRRHLPDAPAQILDVGGATGVHASWLAADGYHVHIVDLTPRHVEKARTDLGPLGVTAEIGDARKLSAPDDTFDAVLVFGPLYHLTDRADRVGALREARRVVRPGGIVAVAAISRFASLFDGLSRQFLFQPEFRAIVEGDLGDGCHRNPERRPGWFTTAFFHRPDELRSEVEAAGLGLIEVVGVEGLAGWLDLDARWMTDGGRETILFAARAIESEPALLGVSAHLVAVARAADSG
jgi:SAM-dependent methyltransferase